jgi:hypothetical protein
MTPSKLGMTMPVGASRSLEKLPAIWGCQIQLFSSFWKDLGKFMKYDRSLINDVNQ